MVRLVTGRVGLSEKKTCFRLSAWVLEGLWLVNASRAGIVTNSKWGKSTTVRTKNENDASRPEIKLHQE